MACCWTCFYTFNSPTPPFFGGNSQCTITFPSHWWTERATSSCMMTLVRSGLLLSSSPFQPVAAALFGSPTIAYSCPFLPTKALLTFSALSRICVKIASQHSRIRFWMLCCRLTAFGWKKWGLGGFASRFSIHVSTWWRVALSIVLIISFFGGAAMIGRVQVIWLYRA